MKTVEQMAREAGILPIGVDLTVAMRVELAKFELFAAIVREDEREKLESVYAQMRFDAKMEAFREKQQEPVAWMWQHDETGRIGFVDVWQVKNGWQENNPRNLLINPLYTTPPTAAQAARQMRDKVVNCIIGIGNDWVRSGDEIKMSAASYLAEYIAALPIPGEEK